MKTDTNNEYSEIAAELKKRLEGDIHFDHYSRLLYSTDASIYQIEPIGVVVPRHKGDVQAVIEIANRFQVPVLPRGGGTSLAGQTVGHAIVLDFSKYMQNVLEVNKEELWCRVQPGLVQDELNAHVRPMGLQFGPDTSNVKPGHHRGHDRQQLRRRSFAHLRQDTGSRLGAHRLAIRWQRSGAEGFIRRIDGG